MKDHSSLNPHELAYSNQSSLRSICQIDVYKFVKEATLSTPKRELKYRKSFTTTSETSLASDNALSMLIEFKLSKHQYPGLRHTSLEQNCKIYPSYKTVQEAKNSCYSPRMSIKISENSAEVELHQMLDYTAQQIIQSQETVTEHLE